MSTLKDDVFQLISNAKADLVDASNHETYEHAQLAVLASMANSLIALAEMEYKKL